MGGDEVAAGGGAGVIGADGGVDVAGVERDVVCCGEPGLLGRTEATSKASGVGLGAVWARAEAATRMQTAGRVRCMAGGPGEKDSASEDVRD